MKPPYRMKPKTRQEGFIGFDYIAKTILSPGGKRRKGVDVFEHCKNVGFVARELIRRQPDWLRDVLFPQGSELVAAVHDIGKISPGFQEKIYRALNQPLGMVSPELDRTIGGHAAVGQVAVRDVGNFIPEIIGRHHGAYLIFPKNF